MVFGFGGMRTDGDVLILAPTLPTQWRSYRFRVRYRGALLEVRVDAGRGRAAGLDGGPVTVRVYGRDYEIDAGIAVDEAAGRPSWPRVHRPIGAAGLNGRTRGLDRPGGTSARR